MNVLFLIGVARQVEALSYKQEGRWFDFRWVSLGFFIKLVFPVAQWALDRLGIEQRRVPGLSPGGVKADGD